MKTRKNSKNIKIGAPILLLLLILVLCFKWYQQNNLKNQANVGQVAAVGESTSLNKPSPQQSPKDNAVVVPTDNARNQQELKVPILMYHHIRNFNNPEDKIGTNLSVSPSDFSAQLDYLEAQGFNTITFQDLSKKNLPKKPIILTFDDGYQNFYDSAYPALKTHHMKATSFIIVNKIGQSDYMTNEEIKEIDQNGIEIGSHTLSHPDLSTSNSDKVKSEVTLSKTKLEEMLRHPIISFCYPSGKYSDSVEQAVKDAGYLYATTTKSGVLEYDTNSLHLSRYRVDNGTDIKRFFRK